jgi:hypothetical protein
VSSRSAARRCSICSSRSSGGPGANTHHTNKLLRFQLAQVVRPLDMPIWVLYISAAASSTPGVAIGA